MSAPRLSAQVLEQLQAHPLPGNVRELENLLHRALALSDGSQLQVDLAPCATAPVAATATSATTSPCSSRSPPALAWFPAPSSSWTASGSGTRPTRPC